MRQWLRKVRVTIPGGFIINPSDKVAKHELKVWFNIEKSISGSTNTAEIKIWNLNEDHRNSIGKEYDDLRLEAGYQPPEGGGNVGILFQGQIRDVAHQREGSDIITTLDCADGDRASRKATISKTYPRNTSVETVVEGIFNEFQRYGIKKGEWKFPDDIEEKKFKRPYSLCGSCLRELNILGQGKGFYWSLQNETLEIAPGDGHLPGVVLISPETGMIDTPTLTDNGVKVSTLLNPEIRPNRTVQIESQTLEMNGEGGMYRVSKANYSGDNRSGSFEVAIHGEAIKGGKIDEGKKQ